MAMSVGVKRVSALLVLCCSLAVGAQPQGGSGYVEFLYKYMPLPDRTDYSRAFYENNVAWTLRAREEMPWGRRVPEREFRHFVLPVRVNNETLDNSREVFYRALKPRVAGLGMKDAILEVNHWCHERVTYRPSDARTSSPLATVKTAYGRCGEESTLLVAALRSVGIPARQVYTPRWAHTDDNHAWVEAWADGRWWFLGACEPEPVLNLGWFNESASRGMLMHTRVFGDYDGPEEVIARTPCFTEINVIGNYAPAATLKVTVVDKRQKAVPGALVEFKLYNYAEFYTVAHKTTDQSGRASLTAGHGDMLLWVSKDGKAAIRKVSFGTDNEVTVTLDGTPLPERLDLDMVPPPAGAALPVVTAEQRSENNRRLALEDSMRQAYERTMPVEAWRGNHRVIREFLDKAKNKEMAHRLLKVISSKDLRDIPMEVLVDNMEEHTDTSEVYCKYVLNPRVENEWLTPYKAFFRKAFADGIKSPGDLTKWCRKHLTVDNGKNPQGLRMQPMSVYRERITDDLGRKIFYVSVARSLGLPSRINEVTGTLETFDLDKGQWTEVLFAEKEVAKASQNACVELTYQPSPSCNDPKYYVHFTLGQIKDGRTRLLTYPEEATWQKDFSRGVKLLPGEYLLTTGRRLASGKVLAHLERFNLPGNSTLERPLVIREDAEEVHVIGSFNAENTYLPMEKDTKGVSEKDIKEVPKEVSLLSTTGRGYYVIGLIAPNQEPTNHALRDISACKEDFEKWGRKMMLVFEGEDAASRFNFQEFPNLPSTVVWGTDVGGKMLSEIREQMQLTSSSLPVFLICDTFNRVVSVHQGYTINLGEQLMKVIRKL